MFGLVPFNSKRNDVTRRDGIWDLRSVFDEFFNDSLFPTAFSGAGSIRADIRETEKEYVIEAEIPGANKENIQIEFRDNILTIGVEHNEEVNEERKDYIRRERRCGTASRSFRVENVMNEGVTAKYKDGILTVTLPKLEETSKKNYTIDIQ